MTRADVTLPRALERLTDLVGADDLAAVAELQRRLTERRFRVLVVGEAKRGKSSLANALLGRPILPTGVVPLTAVATTVTYGTGEHVTVTFADGRTDAEPLAALADYVTEAGNPDNVRAVTAVDVQVPAPLLAGGVELVDTPGTGSVHEHNTAEATAALAAMDAAVFVVSADPPISASERAWLRQVRDQAVRVFCVLNKADYLDTDQLAEAVAFTRDIVSAELGGPVEVWPVSARHALAGDAACADDGWARFVAAFTDYLDRSLCRDLIRSVAQRAARLARGVADTHATTVATLALSDENLDARLVAFAERREHVERGRFESAALLRATVERLLRETNTQAQTLLAGTTSAVQRAVAEHLSTLTGSAGEVERAGLGYASEQIRRVVDDWRTRRAAEVDDALTQLDAELTGRLAGQVAAVRDAAATLFDVQLLDLAPAGHLSPSRRFSYAFAPDVGQTEALAAAVRSRLPGALGRRRVTGYLLHRTATLLDRQVGRARADIAERLADTQRLLLRELDARFDAGAGRIADAVTRAAALRAESAAHVADARDTSERLRAEAVTLAEQLDRYANGQEDVAA